VTCIEVSRVYECMNIYDTHRSELGIRVHTTRIEMSRICERECRICERVYIPMQLIWLFAYSFHDTHRIESRTRVYSHMTAATKRLFAHTCDDEQDDTYRVCE